MKKDDCKYCIYHDHYHGGCNKFKVMPKNQKKCKEYKEHRRK